MAMNGPGGSGARYAVAGKRATLPSEKENAATRFNACCARSSTAGVMCWGSMNGTSTVMCAGTPSFAVASKRCRRSPTNGSAEGTLTANADIAMSLMIFNRR
ncbi:hypothetical protein D9M68_836240 [compost metagenome]